MSFGLCIFSAGQGKARFVEAGRIAKAAEDAGFDAVWTGELYNRSATIPMAMLAAATERVRIGSNIAYGVGRSPLIWAAEARDLDDLSEGRIILGLGNGTPSMMTNWLSVADGSAPAERMRELVTVLRALWRLDEGPVHHDGRFYHVQLAPTSATAPPYRPHLPIWTAGINERMVSVAGAVADGLVGHPMMTSRYVDEVIRPTLRAARGALDDFTIMGIRMCAVSDDVESARRRLAFAIAQYAPSRVYDRFFALHGWEAAQAAIREAARRRDPQGMAAAVPDEVIDAIGVACAPSELTARVAAHAADYDHVNLVAPVWGLSPEEAQDATWAIADALDVAAASKLPDASEHTEESHAH